MRKVVYNLSLVFLIGFTNGCNSQELNYSLETQFGEFKYSVKDTIAVKDLLKTCEKEIPGICRVLKIDYDRKVTIEIYPNQEKYSNSIMNPDLKDSPAISGNFRIQLVSPLSPLKVENKIGRFKYPDRMYFLIHEYVHILMDKLEDPPPLCIDEGIASYYSSHGFYLNMASKYVKQINYIPTIEQLFTSYDKMPAPDLFSFVLIDYIIQTKGKEILADLIRHPNYIKQFNDNWIEYVKIRYY